ncbi:hypothetical protein [Bradyrhizobium commune]|uniref:Uncharacterized protein n=1 Tax=Bradyrhizobium commune TaxID=83627 RepID=A0A7S9DBX2_9BRAD|nr:hypothetical protein [Bradyrhizobium commune]QPF94902.1 hypothetical protein IC761_17220 [Bradyrhizobium commune]
MSSLIVIGRLFLPYRGHINDIGFCSGSDQTLSHRPPRPESVPYDFWCSDRFLSLGRDEASSSIGSVEVSEALVYDNRMHSEIDFTGFSVTVSLQEHAYEAYLDYIGEVRIELGDLDAWDGRILLRIPSRPFAFPLPRGSTTPWETRKPVVGQLKSIRGFAFDEIEIQALRDEQGRKVKFDHGTCEERAGWQPALSLRAQRSASA